MLLTVLDFIYIDLLSHTVTISHPCPTIFDMVFRHSHLPHALGRDSVYSSSANGQMLFLPFPIPQTYFSFVCFFFIPLKDTSWVLATL